MHTARKSSDPGTRVPTLSERALRTIWLRQLFSAKHLCASDGRPITVISPGVLNHDGGPDFLGARIAIGTVTYFGDVEVHQREDEWLAHKHHSDPHYNRVILHVVTSPTEPVSSSTYTSTHRSVPLLIVDPLSDETSPITSSDGTPDNEKVCDELIRCYKSNTHVSGTIVTAWVEQLAFERVELKLRRFEERLKQLCDEHKAIVHEPYPRYHGNPDDIPFHKTEYTKGDLAPPELWDQLLFEGIMEGLGYSKNRRPFLTLAQSMNLEKLRQYSLADVQTMMALLFGAAGLLPSPRALHEKESRSYVRPLRKRWRELRSAFTGEVLHEADWLFFRLRPYNFPTARLATICFLLPTLFGKESFRDLVALFSERAVPPQKKMHSLYRLFHIQPDEFWRHHYHFRQGAHSSGIALGEARVREICINVIIPIVMLYARIFNRPAVRDSTREFLMNVPALPGNTITRKMERELLKSRIRIRSAFAQQGLMQLYLFFCTQGRCRDCAIQHEIPSSP